MKRRLLKVLLGIGATLAVALVSLAATATLRWDRTFDAPLPEVHASTDPEIIERGRYLAYGPAHCAACHTPNDQAKRVDTGEMLPLIGGHEWNLPVGVVRSPNLTPDPETGIGRRTDAQLARMLRHGVRADGRAALPFMEFQNLSDQDLVALISFLRSQPAVRHEVPETSPNLLGKAVLALMIEPIGPSGAPPRETPAPAPTLERGEYLANAVAACAGCHTQRNPANGAYTGVRFSGGSPMPVGGGLVVVPPNLTPDPKTGHIVGWSEEQFVQRFRAGRLVEGSHMPWGLFGKMTDDDLRAIYRYLMSLEPVEHETGPTVQKKE